MSEKNSDLEIKLNSSLEEKDVYKLFNEVKIEESEFLDMDKDVLPIQKERIKKDLNKKIKSKKRLKGIKYSVSAAAIGLVCLVGSGTISPTFAQNIPGLRSIIQTLNEINGDNGKYVDYAKIINKSITDKGITFNINEVVGDDSKLIIGYTVKSDKAINNKVDKNEFLEGIKPKLMISGEQNTIEFRGIGEYRPKKIIDEYTYIGSFNYCIEGVDLGKKLKMDLNISEIRNIKGKWNFAFSISNDELYKKINKFKPNKKVEFADSKINIDEVKISPIGTYISLSGVYKDRNRKKDSKMIEYDYWIVFDDKGVELIKNGYECSSNLPKKLEFNGKMNYTMIKKIPKYLTVVPCKTHFSKIRTTSDGKQYIKEPEGYKEISKPMNGKCPIELTQGKFGKLIIKEIKTENNKTIVKYTAEGKATYTQGQQLYIKEKNGSMITSKSRNIRKNDEKPNEFTMEFEGLSNNKEYEICTTNLVSYELAENLKFKIELNK